MSSHRTWCSSKLRKIHKIQRKTSATLLRNRLWHRSFPVNLAKFLKTPFFREHVLWLLLYYICNANFKILVSMKLHLFITRWCKECLLIYRQYFPDKLNSQIISDLIKSFNDVFHSAKKSKQTENSAKIFLSVCSV